MSKTSTTTAKFTDPPCPAYDRYGELYVALAQKRGGDPFIGRKLLRLLENAGLSDVGASMVQPFGRSGDIKQVTSLTLAAISDALETSGVASADEVSRIAAEMAAFAERPDTTMSLPRIFQAWGRKPK